MQTVEETASSHDDPDVSLETLSKAAAFDPQEITAARPEDATERCDSSQVLGLMHTMSPVCGAKVSGVYPGAAALSSPVLKRDPVAEEEFFADHLLKSYWPSERRAMLVHRFYLSGSLKRQATVEETINSWEDGAGRDWRRRKMRRDTKIQVGEIERHKYLLSESHGEDIGWETAAADWVCKHAKNWRDWWEQQPDSCP